MRLSSSRERRAACGCALALLVTSSILAPANAQQRPRTEPAASRRLAASNIFIEINATDGDAGIQVFLDGEDWDRMNVFDPNGRRILDFRGRRSVGLQGVTELFLESAEPSFDDQPLEEFLALFPAGVYRFSGRATDGAELRGRGRLTHALPDAPSLVLPAEDDDSVDPDDTVIEWLPVADPAGSRIVAYQVIVVREEPSLRVFSVDVDPGTSSVTVPPEFMEPGTAYKYEVLAIETSGNRTLSEREFETE